MSGHVITVEIPKALWKNDNGSHGGWHAHNRLMQTLKRLGWAHAAAWRNEHERAAFEHCRLDVYVQYPPRGRARADPSNADNIGKPIIDGFTKAGLWPDDNWQHVEGPFYRMSRTIAPPGTHRLEFHITPTASAGNQ
jgi:crossover junction endodeoxyribonuclease RusA